MMRKSVVCATCAMCATLLAEPAKTPQVRLEDPRQVQIMWQTANSWELGGISINKSGEPGTAREVWMEHMPELNYYRGYDHWVFLTGLEGGCSYEYYLLGKDADGNVSRIVDTSYSFDYPDYGREVVVTGGPFLTNPDTDSISIVWRTDIPAGAAVDIRKAGEEESKRIIRGDSGIFSAHNTQHVVHVSGLERGTVYEYRPVIFDSRKGEFNPAGNWESFTTLSTEKADFRTLFIADTHGDRTKLGEMLRKHNAKDCDFVIYGGDMVWSAMHAPDAGNLWDEFLNTSVEHFATNVPLIMSRGNHEGGGLYADSYASVFHTESGDTWHAFRTGGFLFVILDSGDICNGDRDSFPGMFERQREWLQKVLDSEESRSADMRIMVVHASTHGQMDGPINERMRKYLGDLLNSADPERRFLLCLAGHEHRCFRYNAGESVNRGCDVVPEDFKVVDGTEWQYTVMLNGGPLGGEHEYTVMEVTGTDGKVQIKMYNIETGKLIDSLEIDKNGNIKEAVSN